MAERRVGEVLRWDGVDFALIFGEFAGICVFGCRGRCLHRPKGSFEFAGDFCKNGVLCRVDAGIDPYNKIWQCIRIRIGL